MKLLRRRVINKLAEKAIFLTMVFLTLTSCFKEKPTVTTFPVTDVKTTSATSDTTNDNNFE